MLREEIEEIKLDIRHSAQDQALEAFLKDRNLQNFLPLATANELGYDFSPSDMSQLQLLISQFRDVYPNHPLLTQSFPNDQSYMMGLMNYFAKAIMSSFREQIQSAQDNRLAFEQMLTSAATFANTRVAINAAVATYLSEFQGLPYDDNEAPLPFAGHANYSPNEELLNIIDSRYSFLVERARQYECKTTYISGVVNFLSGQTNDRENARALHALRAAYVDGDLDALNETVRALEEISKQASCCMCFGVDMYTLQLALNVQADLEAQIWLTDETSPRPRLRVT